jgi:hypothetical protein
METAPEFDKNSAVSIADLIPRLQDDGLLVLSETTAKMYRGERLEGEYPVSLELPDESTADHSSTPEVPTPESFIAAARRIIESRDPAVEWIACNDCISAHLSNVPCSSCRDTGVNVPIPVMTIVDRRTGYLMDIPLDIPALVANGELTLTSYPVTHSVQAELPRYVMGILQGATPNTSPLIALRKNKAYEIGDALPPLLVGRPRKSRDANIPRVPFDETYILNMMQSTVIRQQSRSIFGNRNEAGIIRGIYFEVEDKPSPAARLKALIRMVEEYGLKLGIHEQQIQDGVYQLALVALDEESALVKILSEEATFTMAIENAYRTLENQ